MNISRRQFLQGMIAAAAAPAIVKAENIMKIWVPRQRVHTPEEIFIGWNQVETHHEILYSDTLHDLYVGDIGIATKNGKITSVRKIIGGGEITPPVTYYTGIDVIDTSPAVMIYNGKDWRRI